MKDGILLRPAPPKAFRMNNRRPEPRLSYKAILAGLLILGLVFGSNACGGGGGNSVAVGMPPPVATVDPAPYLRVDIGTLPIVLSAPHGGTLDLPGIPERTLGTTVLDTNTLELAQAVQAGLRARTGKQAHLVAALASRKYVDFNRSAAEAYESSAVAPLYGAYHRALQTAVSASRGQSPTAALLVDLHGQGMTSEVAYRGTRDGRTASLSALYAVPGGFLSALGSGGILVNPSTSGGPENPDFNGGFIVATYGLSASLGIPAVQLEFGLTYRQSPQLPATAATIVEAIVGHLKEVAPESLESARGASVAARDPAGSKAPALPR